VKNKNILYMKHYYQEEDYTCGPSCFRMVLSGFGIDIKESDLTKMMNTSDLYGTTSIFAYHTDVFLDKVRIREDRFKKLLNS